MDYRPVPLLSRNPGPLTGEGTNTWLIDGREPALVDAGVGDARHVAAIARVLGGRPLARVLLTHAHDDHAAGVPALRGRWPDVEVCAHRSAAGDAVRPLSDGDLVPAGNVTLRVIHTPGHAPDHVCFHEPAAGDLFSGDMLVPGSTVMIPAGRGGSLRQYLASLERLAALRPARVLPGHGSIVDDPAALIASYLAHRRQREAEVLECLRLGITDPAAIVGRVYPDLPAALRPAARQTVEAHLDKLREDGHRW